MASRSSIDPSLLPLIHSKACVLASSLSNLQLGKVGQEKGGPPLEGEGLEHGIPEVDQVQLRHVRQPFASRSTPFGGATLASCPLAGHDPVAVSISIRIAQAPSLFALPVMQKKTWDCAFEVEMTWHSSLPLQFTTRVEPVVLDETELANVERWNPFTDRKKVNMSLVGTQADDQTIKLEAVPGEEGAFAQKARFSFPKLAFGAPSQMRPRWLGFATRLFSADSYVLAILQIPTIVMSRNADQQSKAQSLLWGSVTPAMGTQIDYYPFLEQVSDRLKHLGIRRPLTPADLAYLASRAGFALVGGSVRRRPSPSELATFDAWFEAHLQLVHHCRDHYESTSPTIIAGFGFTREAARTAVFDKPGGTFVLRFGSKGGQLVMTLKSRRGSVDHVLLSPFQLQAEGLESTVLAYPETHMLLDPSSGMLHPLQSALQWHYINQDGQALPSQMPYKRAFRDRDAMAAIQARQTGGGSALPPSLLGACPAITSAPSGYLAGGQGDQASVSPPDCSSLQTGSAGGEGGAGGGSRLTIEETSRPTPAAVSSGPSLTLSTPPLAVPASRAAHTNAHPSSFSDSHVSLGIGTHNATALTTGTHLQPASTSNIGFELVGHSIAPFLLPPNLGTGGVPSPMSGLQPLGSASRESTADAQAGPSILPFAEYYNPPLSDHESLQGGW